MNLTSKGKGKTRQAGWVATDSGFWLSAASSPAQADIAHGLGHTGARTVLPAGVGRREYAEERSPIIPWIFGDRAHGDL